tara:strand:+ start:767 stop:1519 length:753 start_codon:yes stop_codon:yes gene_type:complete
MNPQINITPEEWDLIEEYLNEEAVSNETVILKEKLTEISNVQEKIQHVKKVRQGIEDTVRQSKIKEFHEYVSVDEKNSNRNTKQNEKTKLSAIWFAIAAVLVVLIGLFWMLKTESTSEKIFASHFTPDIGLPLKMGSSNNYQFYEGMLDYKQGNYKEATLIWEVLLKNNPESDTLNYFLGVTYLAQGNASTSLKYLEKQNLFEEGMFKEDAAYYAALAKIKEGKFEEAKVLLNKNPSTKNTNLLNDLKER